MSAVIGIVVIVLVLVGSGLAFYFLTKPKKAAPAPTPAPVPAGKCTTATESTKCAIPKPRCYTPAGASYGDCVECKVPADCPTGETCTNNMCVIAPPSGCTTATESTKCAIPKPYCYTPAGASYGDCVECKVPADCPTGKTCTNNMCVIAPSGCTADTQCSTNSVNTYCNTATGTCVQCKAPNQCGSGQVCNSSNVCVTAPVGTICTQPEDCSSNTVNKYCQIAGGASSGVCVQCKEASHCSGLTSVCNLATNKCVAPGCSGNPDCVAPNGLCNKPSGSQFGTCVQCITSSDCSGSNSFCDPSSKTCVVPPPSTVPIWYIKENSGLCNNGTKGTVIPNDSSFKSTSLSFGATICNEVPKNNQTYFYRVNEGDCPVGSNTLGWVRNTAIDPQPNNIDTYGLTVCRAPYGYQIPADQGVSVVANLAPCPNGTKKIGWIRNDHVDFSNAAQANNSYGLTICRKN